MSWRLVLPFQILIIIKTMFDYHSKYCRARYRVNAERQSGVGENNNWMLKCFVSWRLCCEAESNTGPALHEMDLFQEKTIDEPFFWKVYVSVLFCYFLKKKTKIILITVIICVTIIVMLHFHTVTSLPLSRMCECLLAKQLSTFVKWWA